MIRVIKNKQVWIETCCDAKRFYQVFYKKIQQLHLKITDRSNYQFNNEDLTVLIVENK